MNEITPNRELASAHSSITDIDQPNRQVFLSTAQTQALEYLISGGSVTEAAQFAGVSRQTVSRWLNADPDFQAVFNNWREEAAAIVQSRMIAAGEAAMDNVLHAVKVKGDLRASEFVLKSLAAGRKTAAKS
jgi:hypothetical protein